MYKAHTKQQVVILNLRGARGAVLLRTAEISAAYDICNVTDKGTSSTCLPVLLIRENSSSGAVSWLSKAREETCEHHYRNPAVLLSPDQLLPNPNRSQQGTTDNLTDEIKQLPIPP